MKNLEDYEFSKNLIYTKKSFLISHLQKSIRNFIQVSIKDRETYN